MSNLKNLGLCFLFVATFSLSGCRTNAPDAAKVYLFDGKDLSGWREPKGKWTPASSVSLDPTNAHFYVVQPGQGILVNGNKVKDVNLRSIHEHGDCEFYTEFNVSQKSNSGIYFQGRYEIQILDSYGAKKLKHGDCGGIYERWKDEKGYDGIAPRLNASKPAGEWQTFHIIFRAPRFDATGKKKRTDAS